MLFSIENELKYELTSRPSSSSKLSPERAKSCLIKLKWSAILKMRCSYIALKSLNNWKKVFKMAFPPKLKDHGKVLFSRAVPTALLFKWEWNLVKFWVKSHEISQVSSATWRLERMEPSDWLRWVVTWLCSEIWPKGKWCGRFHLCGNNMKTVSIDRGDQELSKTFCGLKIRPLLRKLWAFKDW